MFGSFNFSKAINQSFLSIQDGDWAKWSSQTWTWNTTLLDCYAKITCDFKTKSEEFDIVYLGIFDKSDNLIKRTDLSEKVDDCSLLSFGIQVTDNGNLKLNCKNSFYKSDFFEVNFNKPLIKNYP